MKKFLWLAITLGIVFALLAGCSGGGESTTSTTSATSATSLPTTSKTSAPPTTQTSTSPAPTTSKTTSAPATSKATTAPASSTDPLSDALSKSASITNLYCEVTITNSGITQTMKQWAKMGNPTKLRMEITASGQTTIMIYDGQNYYMYNPATKIAYKMSATSAEQYSSASDETGSLSQYSPVLIGSETVNGMDCYVFQYTVQGVSTKMWVWKQYGLPVKIVSGNMTMEYSNFKFEPIADSMFQLPADAIMMTIPGM